MVRVLAISSQVARGHVGLAAIVPALQALGHEVTALPTVLLSNHPGHAHVAGAHVAPEQLARMLDALAANGWLGEIDAVLTGYMPTVAHVAVAEDAVARVRRANPGAIHLADPVLGDEPKGVYIAADAAHAVRDRLVADADIVKCNRFELEWLAGAPWPASRLAVAVPPGLGRGRLAVTSVADPDAGQLRTVAIDGEARVYCRIARRSGVPNGTGDLFSGLLLGWLLAGDDLATALGRTTAALDDVVRASLGRSELSLAPLVAVPSLRSHAMLGHRPLAPDGQPG